MTKPSVETRNDTVIASGAKLRGNLVSHGDIAFDGQINGNLKASDGDVKLGPNAVVTGDVVGKNVTVAGNLTGNVTAKGLALLASSAQVTGDINCEQIQIEQGAVFIGSSKMKPKPETAS